MPTCAMLPKERNPSGATGVQIVSLDSALGLPSCHMNSKSIGGADVAPPAAAVALAYESTRSRCTKLGGSSPVTKQSPSIPYPGWVTGLQMETPAGPENAPASVHIRMNSMVLGEFTLLDWPRRFFDCASM